MSGSRKFYAKRAAAMAAKAALLAAPSDKEKEASKTPSKTSKSK